MLRNNSHKNLLNKSGPKIEQLKQFLPNDYRMTWFLFFICDFEGSCAPVSRHIVTTHKHSTWQLTNREIYNQMLLINWLEAFQKLCYYQQPVSIFQASKGDNVGYWNLCENHTGILEEFLQNIYGKLFVHDFFKYFWN